MNTNILIDGNYMAFATYSIFSSYGRTKDPLKKQSDQNAFINDLSNKLVQTINSLPRGGRVVFCVDSKSWRKEFMKAYKESREDEDGNKGIMDNDTKVLFYNLIAEFGDALTKSGIIYSKVNGAEGDDLLFKWAEYFNSKGENCIIVTADRDLTQIVRGPETPWNIVWTNRSTNNKLYSVAGWLDCINEETTSASTIFDFNISTDEVSLLSLIRDNRPDMSTVYTASYVFHKILVGDDGDDVPSCWSFTRKDSAGEEKTYRVTDKKAESVTRFVTTGTGLNESDWLGFIFASIRDGEGSDESRMNELAGTILRVLGEVDDKEVRKKVAENIRRNARLVWLRTEMLPYNVNQMIDENIQKGMALGTNGRFTKAAILDGTRFSKVMQRSSMDPFNFFNLPE